MESFAQAFSGSDLNCTSLLKTASESFGLGRPSVCFTSATHPPESVLSIWSSSTEGAILCYEENTDHSEQDTLCEAVSPHKKQEQLYGVRLGVRGGVRAGVRAGV